MGNELGLHEHFVRPRFTRIGLLSLVGWSGCGLLAFSMLASISAILTAPSKATLNEVPSLLTITRSLKRMGEAAEPQELWMPSPTLVRQSRSPDRL